MKDIAEKQKRLWLIDERSMKKPKRETRKDGVGIPGTGPYRKQFG
jgi:hypothetical protein